jgi:hypothetical protein
MSEKYNADRRMAAGSGGELSCLHAFRHVRGLPAADRLSATASTFPIGWTHEISVALWIWIVLFGSAFVVRESEEIRFDFFWAGASDRARRVMTMIMAVALIVAFGVSLPAVIDYVSFMKVEKTAYLKIRFDWLYSIYVVFAVAMIVRYCGLVYRPSGVRRQKPSIPPRRAPAYESHQSFLARHRRHHGAGISWPAHRPVDDGRLDPLSAS